MIPVELRCHHLRDPEGIDVAAPRLSWTLTADEPVRGAGQRAFQILVADSRERLAADEGNLWDSGRVDSDAQSQAYQGAPLRSRQQCWWKVRVWPASPALRGAEGNGVDRGQDDCRPAWSAPACWRMGLLDAADWQASWIEVPFELTPEMPPGQIPASRFRRAFELAQAPQRAVLFASALGVYEVCLNGTRVGAQALAPEWTDYRRRVQYQTFDVTAFLHPGVNTIAATVCEGWYAGRIGFWKEQSQYGSFRPRFLAQLHVSVQSGGEEVISTDRRWQGSVDGPIRFAGLLDGQITDARMGGSDRDGVAWEAVRVVAGLEQVELVAQMNEPIAVVTEQAPISISRAPSGATIVDMGQNLVGWSRLRLRGKPGQIVNLRHAEMLDERGELYTAPLRCALYKGSPGPHHGTYGMMGGARQMDTFICAGRGAEVFEPRFTQHGFRYVEVTGAGAPSPSDITGCVVSSTVERAGWFECSDPTINRLMDAVRWTQLGNLQGIPLDCPQRDERLGWLGDAQVFCQASCYNAGMAAFYAKYLRDVRDAQWPNGRFPDFAPNPLGDKRAMGAPAWSDGGLIIPWTHYLHYGDRQLLADHFPAAKRHVESIATANPDFLWTRETGNNYGDHLNGDRIVQEYWRTGGSATPVDVFATTYFAHSAALLERMAGVLGLADDRQRYETLHQSIVRAFRASFVDADGRIQGDTQGGYVLALHFDLLTQPQREQAVQHLLRLLDARGGYPDTGIQTTNRMMLELTRAGRVDVAYRILNNDRIPSWRYMIDHGATTIWERWDSWSETNGFQDPSMNSFNHYAMGAVAEWIYRTIGGINPDPDAPGFAHVIIRPQPGGGITWANTRHRCIRGTIATDWRTEAGVLNLEVTIPPNTAATVHIPCRGEATVTESGLPLDKAPGVRGWRRKGEAVVVQLGSGRYRFNRRAAPDGCEGRR